MPSVGWWPSARRRLDGWAEVERRHQSDYELWSGECHQLEAQRQSHLLTAQENDSRLGEAIKARSGQGALEYVLVRHNRVWDENTARIDSSVREQALRLIGGLHTRSQMLRLFSESIPSLIAGLASAESVEIRPGLSAERLARIAPDDQRLFAGDWFASQFVSRFESYIEWKVQNPSTWRIDPERSDPSSRGRAFERYLLQELQKAGCERVALTKTTGDFGADLVADHKGQRIIIQAKSYDDKVGLEAVQQVHAAKQPYQAEKAWVITDSEFTSAARALADQTDVGLIDKSSLDVFALSVLRDCPFTAMELAGSPRREPETPAAVVRPDSPGTQHANGIQLFNGLEMQPSLMGRLPHLTKHLIAAVAAVVVVGLGLTWIARPSSTSDQGEVLAVVDRWVSTTRSLDIEGQLACYAPRLAKFYRLTDVGFDVVAKNKRDAFGRFTETRTYRLRDVKFENLDERQARVVFDKDWDFRDSRTNRRFAGSGRQRLTLEKLKGSWLIIGEEELDVYSVTGSVVGR